MNKEAFEDLDIASMLNKNFVCVLVDMEERPDINQIYMEAVMQISGQGGWPLNFFTLPDSRPIFGEIYKRKDDLLNVASNILEKWIINPTLVYEVAEELGNDTYNDEIVRKIEDSSKTDNHTILKRITESLSQNIDTINGGIKGNPKFPMPGLHLFLLIYSQHTQHHSFNEFIHKSLIKIANGGIYDDVGGGFFRYTIDEQWAIPHFEKMLYDNAQLLRVYATTYRIDPQFRFRLIIEQTAEFMLRELHHHDGGFYSSIAADTINGEGAYYTWSKDEFDSIIGVDAELLASAFGVTPVGNYFSSNVLCKSMSDYQLAAVFDIPFGEIKPKINNGLKRLLEARNLRQAPRTDDKIIASWNALAVTGFLSAYRTLQNPDYLRIAIETINIITSKLQIDDKLFRVWCKDKTYGTAFLCDYAFLIQALIELYNATFDWEWLKQAQVWVDRTIELFLDKKTNLFYFTPKNSELFARKMDLIDRVTPSGNVVMASSLHKLGSILNVSSYKNIAKQMIDSVSGYLLGNGAYLYAWAQYIFEQTSTIIYIYFSHKNREKIKTIQSKTIHPNLIFIENQEYSCIQLHINGRVIETDDIDDIINAINSLKING